VELDASRMTSGPATPRFRRYQGRLLRAAVSLLAVAILGIAVACSSGGSDVTLTASGGGAGADGSSSGEGDTGGGDRSRPLAGAPASDGADDGSTATPEPAVGNIADLSSQYGDPPGYDFARLRIPLLNVDAPVGVSVVDGAGGAKLGSPEGPATVFWYNLDAWPGLGGVPGGGGNAIFGGHVDISAYLPYADVTYHGPAVFRDLHLLKPGDRVFVDRDGGSLEYVVEWSQDIAAGDTSRWGEIWSSDVGADSITLYTCGGDFDLASASYADRLVVRATIVG